MMRSVLHSKIHRAVVTGADLNYEGSITIDQDLLDASKIVKYEKVHVLNIANGERAETYAIPGDRGKGEIILNGALARLAQAGDPVIILSYGLIDENLIETVKPIVVLVDKNNRVARIQTS